MGVREGCYSFILSRTPYETYSVDIHAYFSRTESIGEGKEIVSKFPKSDDRFSLVARILAYYSSREFDQKVHLRFNMSTDAVVIKAVQSPIIKTKKVYSQHSNKN
jgi:hypothetical protein